jgi:Flp pilus assembly protein TadG
MKQLWQCRRGNVSVIFVVALVPLLAIAGGGVDLTGRNRQEATIQNALDGAVLAGAKAISNQIAAGETANYDGAMAAAEEYFRTVIRSDGQDTEFGHEEWEIWGRSSASYATGFLGLVGLTA